MCIRDSLQAPLPSTSPLILSGKSAAPQAHTLNVTLRLHDTTSVKYVLTKLQFQPVQHPRILTPSGPYFDWQVQENAGSQHPLDLRAGLNPNRLYALSSASHDDTFLRVTLHINGSPNDHEIPVLPGLHFHNLHSYRVGNFISGQGKNLFSNEFSNEHHLRLICHHLRGEIRGALRQQPLQSPRQLLYA